MFRIVALCIIITMLTINPAIAGPEPTQGKVVNLTGGGLCYNSAVPLIKEKVSALKPGDILTVVIETENKGIVKSVIKLEELPVVFEEIDDKPLTRFLIRLK